MDRERQKTFYISETDKSKATAEGTHQACQSNVWSTFFESQSSHGEMALEQPTAWIMEGPKALFKWKAIDSF